MLDSNEKLYISSAAGALFFMLRKNDLPMWKKITFFAIGSFSASMATEALIGYFQLCPAVSGGLGFFCGVLVLSLAETLIDFAQNPAKLVSFWRGLRGDNNQT